MNSYLMTKTYQTSFIPLWLKAQKIIHDENGCKTDLGDSAVVLGYSEGGNSAVAHANALECMGVNVIKLLPGAGPYLLASTTLVMTHGQYLLS